MNGWAVTHATMGAGAIPSVLSASKSISCTLTSVVSRLLRYAAISVPLRNIVESDVEGWTAKREVEAAREASRTVMTFMNEDSVIESGDTMFRVEE
jgi:hypothetical protein